MSDGPVIVEIDNDYARRISSEEARALVQVEELRLKRSEVRWHALKIIAIVFCLAATCVADIIFR